MASTIRLGTASPSCRSTSKETIADIASIASRAAESKIDILLLPEAYIGGYPRGTAFGCVIGSRSEEGREEYAKYFDNAIDLGDTVGSGGGGAGLKWVRRELSGAAGTGDGEQVRGDGSREELERIARDSGVFIVVGCIEKAGGSLYCSCVYICPKEGMTGKRRKVMPVSLPLSIHPHHHKLTSPDRHRASLLGPRLPQHPPCRVHHRPRRAHQPRRRHLLGKLHAPAAPNALLAEHQPLPRAHGRQPRRLDGSHANRRRRGPLFRGE